MINIFERKIDLKKVIDHSVEALHVYHYMVTSEGIASSEEYWEMVEDANKKYRELFANMSEEEFLLFTLKSMLEKKMEMRGGADESVE